MQIDLGLKNDANESYFGTYIATSYKILHPLCLTLLFAYATM